MNIKDIKQWKCDPLDETTACRVLDHGFIRYVDHYGDDQRIVDSARVSYQNGTRKVRDNEGLINYLVRNKHTSPLEMVDFLFHVKATIFVCREWVRHRLVSMNEMSLRYSEAIEDFYTPETFRGQDKINKQGSVEAPELDQEALRESYRGICSMAYEEYKLQLEQGVAREHARMVLPVSWYTTWYWKCNLRTLWNFIELRGDNTAQYEIRQYVEPITHITRAVVPITYKALMEHT